MIIALFAFAALAAQQRPDTIVKLAGKPLHAGVATLVQEITIGVPDGPEEYMLVNVNDLAVAPDGSIIVYDRTVPAIRVYDAAGKFVRTLGRKGSGPGEYVSGGALAVLRDGRVLFWDPQNARINVYNTDGTVGGHWGMEVTGSNSGSSMVNGYKLLMVDTSGLVYNRRTITPTVDVQVPAPSGGMVTVKRPDPQRVRTVWVRIRPNGTVMDTVDAGYWAPSAEAMSAARLLRVTAPNGRARMSAGVPFDPRPWADLSPLGYLVTGFADRYAFELNARGAPVVSVRRPGLVAKPVTDGERAAARTNTTERMRAVDPSWTWNGPEIPRVRPLYTVLTVAQDGRVWIEVERDSSVRESDPTQPRAPSGAGGGNSRDASRPSGVMATCSSGGAAVWDVYEPSGAYVGQVRIPAKLSVEARRGDYVWGVVCDDDDNPMVRRYRIAWR